MYIALGNYYISFDTTNDIAVCKHRRKGGGQKILSCDEDESEENEKREFKDGEAESREGIKYIDKKIKMRSELLKRKGERGGGSVG